LVINNSIQLAWGTFTFSASTYKDITLPISFNTYCSAFATHSSAPTTETAGPGSIHCTAQIDFGSVTTRIRVLAGQSTSDESRYFCIGF